jgi:DNA helicase-2/ATP-dependent DNA helicase PcrA
VKPTPEQSLIIHHPTGSHSRIISAAGATKTTTLSLRVKHMVVDNSTDPKSIVVLMFNRRAREQFTRKLEEIGIAESLQPAVHTFHSYAYRLINEAVANGLIPVARALWIGDKEELARRCIVRAIKNLEKSGEISSGSVNVEEAWDVIGDYKGSLIPPTLERAGHRGNVFIPPVFIEYEKLRDLAGAITYDDFIPLAVRILESQPEFRDRFCGSIAFILADEYQDVNFGMQRLIELIAGDKADIMAVGDDDQVIYGWRGSRVEYINHKFKETFSTKPVIDYQLTRSFRLAPLSAQCAYNCIKNNKQRIGKNIVSPSPDKTASLRVWFSSSEQPSDVNKDLARQIRTCVQECGDPTQVVALGRSFAQLSGLETELIFQKIPFKVIGRGPFIERNEIVTLLNYVRAATVLDEPLNKKTGEMFVSIANTPNRRLNRDMLEKIIARSKLTLRQTLSILCDDVESPLPAFQRRALESLSLVIVRIGELLSAEHPIPAAQLLTLIINAVGYTQHYENFYGKGEASSERIAAVTSLCELAEGTQLDMIKFFDYLKTLDPTQGKPDDQLIVLTTAYRTKGLEYDYVFIPECVEGFMPMLQGNRSGVYDLAGIISEPEPTDIIEDERRVFFVAITRARKGIFIGTSKPPMMGFQEGSSHPMPSRFIKEMAIEVTERAIAAIQGILNGNEDAKSELFETIKQSGHDVDIVEDTIQNYLSEKYSDFIGKEVMPLIEKVREENKPALYIEQNPEGFDDDNMADEPVAAMWWDDTDD